jgi:hypothetical protein
MLLPAADRALVVASAKDGLRSAARKSGRLRAERSRSPVLLCGVARKRRCRRECAYAPYMSIMEFIQMPLHGLPIAVRSGGALA